MIRHTQVIIWQPLCQKDDDAPVSANGNRHTVAVAGHESIPHPIAVVILPKETDRDNAVLEAVKDIDLRLRWVWKRRVSGIRGAIVLP